MKMKCEQCGCHESTHYLDREEFVCDDCGVVHKILPLSQGTGSSISKTNQFGHVTRSRNSDTWSSGDDGLGSVMFVNDAIKTKSLRLRLMNRRNRRKSRRTDKMFLEVSMIISRYTQESNRELLHITMDYYRRLQEKHFFVGIANDVRAAALTFYILKKHNVTVSLAQHSKITLVDRRRISKLARRIATHLRNPQIFGEKDVRRDATTILDNLLGVGKTSNFREVCLEFVTYVENLLNGVNERMTPNCLVATIWISSRLEGEPYTQEEISNLWPSSVFGLRHAAKNLCERLGIDRKKLVTHHGYDIKQIMRGIRI